MSLENGTVKPETSASPQFLLRVTHASSPASTDLGTLFLEAFDGYRTETLKAMVQTWPFVRLPLGALIDLSTTLQGVS